MNKVNKPWVLITGANGGIGQALVTEFATNEYNVIASDITPQKFDDSDNIRYLHVDLQKFVNDECYANDYLKNIYKITGNEGVSALINNAATQILGHCEEISRENWGNSFDTNVTAPFFLIQCLLPSLQKNNGAVVNISSIHATQTKRAFVSYATSKAALSALTRNLAVDLRDKIRINAIEPAAVATQMLKDGFEGKNEAFKQLESYHPLARIATPQEIAELTLFLCSQKAKFIHGACISATGGINGCLYDPE